MTFPLLAELEAIDSIAFPGKGHASDEEMVMRKRKCRPIGRIVNRSVVSG